MSTALKSLTPPVLIGVSIGCSLLLFSSDELIQATGLDFFANYYRTEIGFALLAAFSLLAGYGLWSLWEFTVRETKDFWWLRGARKGLHSLTLEEKELLREFVHGDKATIHLPIQDAAIASLTARKIVVRTSNLGNPGSLNFAHGLQPWARTHLIAHPELLE